MFHSLAGASPVRCFWILQVSDMIPLTLKNKLMTFCQHPQKVYNKYTHEPVVVPCGVCPSCVLKRSSIQTNILCNYAEQFKYCYFVTLTYDNRFLPLLRVQVAEMCTDDPADVNCVPDVSELRKDDPNEYIFNFRVVPRTSYVKLKKSTVNRYFSDPDVEFNRILTPSEYIGLHDKFSKRLWKKHHMPYLNARDLDLFLKRLRTYYPDETIRYYACGEYGPKTFRPHWHLLLFSNSEAFSKTILQNVPKAWSYGRVDATQSRGFAAPYVSGYVNSFVSLPDLYLQMPRRFQPRSFHSIGFRRNPKFPDTVRLADIEEVASLCLDGVCSSRNGYVFTLKPDWSYLIRLFPRFEGAYSKSPQSLYQLLHAAKTAPERLICGGFSLLDSNPFLVSSRDSILKFSREYMEYLNSFMLHDKRNLPQPDVLIADVCRLYAGVSLDDRVTVSRLYRFFLRCSKFFRTYGFDRYVEPNRSLFRVCEHVIDFWRRYDYLRLVDFYHTLEDCNEKRLLGFYEKYYSKNVFKEDDTFDPDVSDFSSMLSARALMKCRDKVKHKEVNDMYGIFILDND
ncbi:replication initiator protein [Microvirus mar62]|uniref:Replication initiator protein n=1 Tax=Microvirus mar62 TaxID=2851199 RepID=A0A8F5MJF9_9VIRU|nr:replication initiator protein [Microvirus mar62]